MTAITTAVSHVAEEVAASAGARIADDLAESVLLPGLILERRAPHPHPFIPIGETRLSKAELTRGMMDDASGLEKGMPGLLLHPTSKGDIRGAYETARELRTTVVMSGARHSMGGQNVVDGAIHLDMTSFNKMAFDAESGSLFVQPGATWADIQRYLDPMGQSPRVMQSSNIFTVGGSLAADIHGRDMRFGPIAESVRSMALITPNGEEVLLRPSDDLFRATLGGYGLTGTISEVELATVPNELHKRVTHNMSTTEFPQWYAQHVENNPNARFMQARVNPTNLKNMHVITFEAAEAAGPLKAVKHKGPGPFNAAIGLPYKATMRSRIAKRLVWALYRHGDNNLLSRLSKPTRNQTMSVPLEFLRSKSTSHTQVLQEYFVPKENLVSFLSDLQGVVKEHDPNLLTITVRHVPADANSMLTVSPEDSFAVMTYMDQKLKPGAQQAWDSYAQAADAAVVKNGGRPYLAYRNAATSDQLLAGYPGLPAFADTVRAVDPEGLLHHKLKPALLQAADSAAELQ